MLNIKEQLQIKNKGSVVIYFLCGKKERKDSERVFFFINVCQK